MSAVIGDIYEVSVLYTGTGSTFQNNFGFVCVTNVAGDAQANLASAFRTAMIKNTSGGLLYYRANDLTVTTITVADVKPGTAATYESTAAGVTGSETGEPLPWQIAVCYSLRTALKGRSYHGRIYLPGVCVDAVDTDTLNASSITAHTTIATQLLAVFGPSGSNGDWRLAVISRFLNHVERVTPVATEVTSISIDPIVRTQRRRVSGVGT